MKKITILLLCLISAYASAAPKMCAPLKHDHGYFALADVANFCYSVNARHTVVINHSKNTLPYTLVRKSNGEKSVMYPGEVRSVSEAFFIEAVDNYKMYVYAGSLYLIDNADKIKAKSNGRSKRALPAIAGPVIVGAGGAIAGGLVAISSDISANRAVNWQNVGIEAAVGFVTGFAGFYTIGPTTALRVTGTGAALALGESARGALSSVINSGRKPTTPTIARGADCEDCHS